MKITTTITLSLLLLWSYSTSAQKYSKEAKAHNAQAEIFFTNGDYSKALSYYLKAEQLHPADPYFAYYAGLCYSKLGYLEEALPQLENAKKVPSSKYKDLDYLLGQCYHATMKFNKAIESYTLHKNNNSKNPLEVKKAEAGIRYCNNAIELIKKPVNVTIKNLGENINSEHPDYNPVLPVDESMIIFTSRREHEIHKGKDPKDDKYYENIYINVKSSDDWTTPTPLGNIINTPSHDASMAISADGHQLYVYMPNNNGDIFVSNLLGAIWGEPVSLGPNINSDGNESSMSISADGKAIFFISDRKGGIGGNDIYMSRKQESGTFGPAKLLSGKINTTENEFSPFIHPDGKTLYFSSTGYNSMGGYDIFSCTINIETGEILTTPVNVGYPINTTGDDIDFVWSADNKRAFFASVREEGYGEEDIYMLESEDQAEVSLSILKGIIYNCNSKEPIQATITVTDNVTQKNLGSHHSNSFTGKYVLVLPGGVNYNITVSAPEFSYYSKNINLPIDSKYAEFIDTVCLQKITPGAIFSIYNLQYNKGKLLEASYPELDKFVQMLNSNPDIKILINVYTSADGDEVQNNKLTEYQAKQIKDYFVSKSIDSKRLFYKGYGADKPIASNDTEANRALNRRTEIEIMK